MHRGKFAPELIAPCGMNCGICKRYLAYSRGIPKERSKVIHCQGCIPSNKNCYIKRGCKKISNDEIRFCFECDKIPCGNLTHLDKRYWERYGMSMVENQKEIEAKGVSNFLDNQESKYMCPRCGDVVSVHDGKCYNCGHHSNEKKG